MIRNIVAAFFVMVSTISFAAEKIDLTKLNQIVDQTNFIVNKGCSGTLIDLKNKLVLTNNHCINISVSVVEREETTPEGVVRKVRTKKYADVILEQNGYLGFDKVSTTMYLGEIVAEEKNVDLAIIRIKSDIPHKISSKILPESMNILRGEGVYIVGNPGGLDATIVRGIVSNLNRSFKFPWTDNNTLPMIQFSGGIYGGNSGGALYNDDGYLIGVPAAKFSAADFIGLAVPVDVVRKFMWKNCLAEAFDKDTSNVKCIEDKKLKDKREEDKNK